MFFRPAGTSLISLWVGLGPDNAGVHRCEDGGCDLLGGTPSHGEIRTGNL